MLYRLLTDLTVALHFAFLIFVVAGGLLARRHRWVAIPHLLAAVWGVYVEAMPGIICPLTPLENLFAFRAQKQITTECRKEWPWIPAASKYPSSDPKLMRFH